MSFVCGGIGNTYDMLKDFTLTPSVTDMICRDTFVTSYGPFYVCLDSLYSLSFSPGRIKKCFEGGNLLQSAFLIRFSALIVYISDLEKRRAWKRSL